MKEKVSPTQRVLNFWAIILIIWSIYRAKFKTDLPLWFDEFIAKPLVFILPVVYYIKKIEGKKFFKGIDLRFTHIFQEILLGFLIGIIFFSTGLLGNFLKFKTFFFPSGKTTTLTNLGLVMLISLATSISEEVLSRGFVLKRLYEDSKNIFTASFSASILFFFLHVPMLFTSEKIIGFLLLRVMFTDLILSLAVSFIYLERKNLILPILVHAFYNLSIYLFI